jgi:CheY-like chemotaxis protein
MSITVLYVDDNAPAVTLMREVVSIVPDSRFLAAMTGEGGVELAISHKPDLIILDIRLPDMTGYDVLSRLKRSPETADIPVIALSGDAARHDIERGRQAGFRQYITKPFPLKKMLEAIETVAAEIVH